MEVLEHHIISFAAVQEHVTAAVAAAAAAPQSAPAANMPIATLSSAPDELVTGPDAKKIGDKATETVNTVKSKATNIINFVRRCNSVMFDGLVPDGINALNGLRRISDVLSTIFEQIGNAPVPPPADTEKLPDSPAAPTNTEKLPDSLVETTPPPTAVDGPHESPMTLASFQKSMEGDQSKILKKLDTIFNTREPAVRVVLWMETASGTVIAPFFTHVHDEYNHMVMFNFPYIGQTINMKIVVGNLLVEIPFNQRVFDDGARQEEHDYVIWIQVECTRSEPFGTLTPSACRVTDMSIPCADVNMPVDANAPPDAPSANVAPPDAAAVLVSQVPTFLAQPAAKDV